MAWSAGKTAFVRSGKNEEKSLDVPSTVGGLAFAPKGLRLAVAHYNGVTLWFPNMAATPEFLAWAGSHHSVTFSPDNKFLVTAMHEPALHGWRLADNRHMRMTGYPGRVRSMSWSVGGKALATSGADTVILWPFASKDGPMGKEPAMLAPLQARVSAVACHPKQDILAAGYSDGTILMVRMTDGAEILVRRNGTAPVAALAWNSKGTLAGVRRGGWRRRSAGALGVIERDAGYRRTPVQGTRSRAADPSRFSREQCLQRPLIPRTNLRVKHDVFGRWETRFREGNASRIPVGDGGTGIVRRFAD